MNDSDICQTPGGDGGGGAGPLRHLVAVSGGNELRWVVTKCSTEQNKAICFLSKGASSRTLLVGGGVCVALRLSLWLLERRRAKTPRVRR